MTCGRIVYLTTWQHQYTLRRCLDAPPGPGEPELVPIASEPIDRFAGPLPVATYVFTDTDRLDGSAMRAAVAA
jgi:hypothetical protein